MAEQVLDRPLIGQDAKAGQRKRGNRRLGRGERRLVDVAESPLTRLGATLRLPRSLLLGRLGYALREPLSHLGLVPGSGVALGGRQAYAPLCTPADPWPGDTDSGMAPTSLVFLPQRREPLSAGK